MNGKVFDSVVTQTIHIDYQSVIQSDPEFEGEDFYYQAGDQVYMEVNIDWFEQGMGRDYSVVLYARENIEIIEI